MQVFGTTLPPPKRKKSLAQKLIPVLTMMNHPDLTRIGDRVFLPGLLKGERVALGRAEPMFTAPDKVLGKPLDDPYISREPVYLEGEQDGVVHLDLGRGKIAVTADIPAAGGAGRFSAEQVDHGVVLTLAERVILLLHRSPLPQTTPPATHGLIGHSEALLGLRREIDRVADLHVPVLLLGASGTGKELAARAIHQASRPDKPFVSVNLGAIPANLAASELFGAVRGSFTGADRHQQGYFRAAQGGTLFLDEVGEASPEVQVMLLRALETGEISPVGAQTTTSINVRFIAATDANLAEKMAQDSFKTPLFHRLAGYIIQVPSLAQRREDLPRLFCHFARLEMARLGEGERLETGDSEENPWLPAELMASLLNYGWPGNVRQLRNVVRQILIGCRGLPALQLSPELAQLIDNEQAQIPTHGPVPLDTARPKRKPAQIGAEELARALRTNGWDIKAAATQLGISRAALYLLIEKTPGLRKASDIPAAEIHQGLARHHNDVDKLSEELGVSARALRRRISQLPLS